jgi:hypothetical protein
MEKNNRKQARKPAPCLDVVEEFKQYDACLPAEVPPQARLFAETAYLAGLASALRFFRAHGPKGSRGFIQPTAAEVDARLKFVLEAQQIQLQENAAFAGADDDPPEEVTEQ